VGVGEGFGWKMVGTAVGGSVIIAPGGICANAKPPINTIKNSIAILIMIPVPRTCIEHIAHWDRLHQL
jgi:hypothetical protein